MVFLEHLADDEDDAALSKAASSVLAVLKRKAADR
jgi:hypothetical protein